MVSPSDQKATYASPAAYVAACEAAYGIDPVNGKPKRKIVKPTDAGGEPVEPCYSVVASVATPEGQTDLANARRLVDAFGSKIRFCHPWNKWLIWDGTRWQIDDTGAIQRLAKGVADNVWHWAGAFDDKDSRRFAMRTASSTGINAMLALAESEVPISVDEMDSNPWLLNFPNGTLDLRTGELRKHRQEDCITKLCPTEFDPEAKSPVWEQFQRDVTGGDDELVAFKQRLLGYTVTGDVREQILPIAYGVGSNGKSTEIDAISFTIGEDYFGTLPRSLLMASKQDRHPTELTTLFGRRLMIAHETDSGGRLSEALVKQLTGGDKITARGMREDFWTFAPTHKILLLTNHKPDVRGTDHAIWRRLRLIPYNVRFDGERRDKSMPEKLANEKQGILAWLVRGCMEWQRIGLSEPQSVMAATDSYRSEQDIITQFISECCFESPHAKGRASHLYEAYRKWCEGNGEWAQKQRKFGEALTEKGYQRYPNNGTCYKGIGLLAERSNEDF